MARRSLPNNLSIDNLEFERMPRRARFQNLNARRFGRLLVLGYAGTLSGRSKWYCLCDCGTVTAVRSDLLLLNQTRSCGCLAIDTARSQETTHGMTKTPEYKAWVAMRSRCYDLKNPSYSQYGKRGIRVCSRWLKSFDAFFADLGHRPSPQHSLERKNVNLGYGPDNCRWATPKEQARNRTSSRFIEVNGQSKTLAEWCEITGLSWSTVDGRIRRGQTPAKALGITKRLFTNHE